MSEGFGALTSATVRCAKCGMVLGPTGNFTVIGSDWFHSWCAPATARGTEIATLQKLYGDKSEQYVAERLAHEETRSQLSQALRELGEARATKQKLLESNVRYFKDMQLLQRVLCPTFGDCADNLAEGEKCACGFEDGPWGNAIPPNRAADEAMRSTAELRGALEPFAKLADVMPNYIPDDALVVLTNTNGGMIDTSNRVTVGDLRRAKIAFEVCLEIEPK